MIIKDRQVEGAYIQPLPTVTTGRPFHGLMGGRAQGGKGCVLKLELLLLPKVLSWET